MRFVVVLYMFPQTSTQSIMCETIKERYNICNEFRLRMFFVLCNIVEDSDIFVFTWLDIYGFQYSLWSITTHKDVFFLFQHYPSWFVLDYWFFDIQILVLFKFNGNLMLISNHHFIFVSTESRSCSKSLPQQNKFLSSANKTNFRNLNTLQILLMYNITNYGLSTEPCGAPHDLSSSQFICTYWCLLPR